MTPNKITLLFKEARDAFPPFEGKPTDDNLLLIREMLLPILMEIPYDQLGGVHSLTSLFTDPARYATNHGTTSVHPVRFPLYDSSNANNATTVVCICMESAHKAHLDDFASYEAAECGAAKFLRGTIDEVWYNNLKDADTFYTKVSALEIMTFLDANSGGLHAINMISLRTNMHQYYVQADGISQHIVMLEEEQKKSEQRGMPIADIELVMMASAAVLAAQHFPCKVDNCGGLPSSSRMWAAWKTVFRLAHIKRQCQILASGGGEPLGRVHGVLPEAAPTIGRLEMALNNLALAVTNNTAILQQLTAANLALTTTVTMLTATNKKLVDAAARAKGGGTPAVTPMNSVRGIRATWTPFPGNYCWTHGHHCNKHHTSATCGNKAVGHCNDATALNTMGGSTRDIVWDRART
jgi:hypothetical protein